MHHALPNFVAELSQYGVISLIGEQRNDYLQGQVTINVNKLSPDLARFGCHCDFKGKTWSSFVAAEFEQKIMLVADKTSLPKSLAELKKYAVFSKVDISDESQHFDCYGFVGEQVKASLNTIFPSLPTKKLEAVSNSIGLVIAIDPSNSVFLAVVKSSEKSAFIAATRNVKLSPSVLWDATCIQLGIANISEQTANEFVPQMFNMQALDGIDFDKGCYMGQEVVARTKFLGKNKRAAFILYAESDTSSDLIQPGSALEKKAGDNWRSGGTIINSASYVCPNSNIAQTWLLAVLANDTQTADVLRLKGNPEALYSVQDLPYSIADK